MLHSMEGEFPVVWVGGVVVVNSNNRVKPNSVELSWGCVEVELKNSRMNEGSLTDFVPVLPINVQQFIASLHCLKRK